MASATAASNQTIDSDGEFIYQASIEQKPAVTIAVRCNSTNAALVRVNGLHQDEDFARVPIGETQYFAFHPKLQDVFVKGDGGNTNIDWHVIVAGK